MEEILELLEKACKVIDPSQLWVNPDCGLKTRGWEEIELQLADMVAAARSRRQGCVQHYFVLLTVDLQIPWRINEAPLKNAKQYDQHGDAGRHGV